MFIDSRNLPEGTVVETDVCIVGGGPAGITLARELMGQSFRVALLESGGLDPDEATQSLYEAENVGLPYFPLDRARARHFGGCTNHWGGWSRPLDETDFDDRPWIPFGGWPFSYAHLLPYYERAQKLCHLGPFRYDFSYWETALRRDGRRRLALPDEGLIDYLWQIIPRDHLRFGDVFRSEIEKAENVDVYLRSNVVEIEADESAQAVKSLRVASLDGRQFRVAAKVVVLACGGVEIPRLLLSSDRAQRRGIGNQNDLVGRFFMEHPYVRSGVLALSRPDAFYTADVMRLDGTLVASGLGPSAALQRRERIANFCVRLMPVVPEWLAAFWSLRRRLSGAGEAGDSPSAPAGGLGPMLTNPHRVAGLALRMAARKFLTRRLPPQGFRLCSVHYILEQVPDPESRVQLGSDRDRLGVPRVRLDWRLNDQDRRLILHVQETLKREFQRSGAGALRRGTAGEEASWPALLRESKERVEDLVYRRQALEFSDPISSKEASSQLLFGSHHHLGTTRMSESPRQGVVDPNGRVHSMRNLYVAGSSVFPVGGISNPTLTILALAIRLGDHLKAVVTGRDAARVGTD